jgi:hypothetical protein
MKLIQKSSLINILPRIVKSYDSSHQNVTVQRKSEIRVGVGRLFNGLVHPEIPKSESRRSRCDCND